MFIKLIKYFIKLEFQLKRLLGTFSGKVGLQRIRWVVFWLIILFVQIFSALKLLDLIINSIQNLTLVHDKRLVLESTVHKIRSDDAQIKDSPQAVEKILGSLPGANENYNLLEKLNLSAANNQVGLLEVNFLPNQKSKISNLYEQPVEVKLQGTFKNIFSFLDEIGSDQRPTFTESINLTTKESNFSKGYIRARAVVRTYFNDAN